MALTRERRMYAAVLGLGLIALGVDRFLLGGAMSPATTLASDAVIAAAGAVAPGEQAIPRFTPISDVPARLRDAGTRAGLGAPADAFRIPEGWLVAQAVAEHSRAAQTSLRKLELTAVSLGPSPAVVINGHVLRPGRVIDGLELIAADAVRVVVLVDGRQITLDTPQGRQLRSGEVTTHR